MGCGLNLGGVGGPGVRRAFVCVHTVVVHLDKLLGALELDVDPFAVCDVRRDWAVAMAPDEHVTLHFCVQGAGVVRAGSRHTSPFGPGALIVVPSGIQHRVEPEAGSSDELDAAAECAVEQGLRMLRAGDEGPGVRLVCGRVRACYLGGLSVFGGLREPAVVQFPGDASLDRLFESMLAEQAALGPGSTVLLRALMMQCLVALFRRLCSEGDCRLSWLAALEDPRLGAALAQMVEHPARAHSLESLAAAAGMSRSSFAEHFSRTLGRTAMEFLRQTRLRRAAALLRTTTDSVQSVAEAVGFSSRSHFSTAFRNSYGVDPATYRRAGA